ncbi:MAG: TonB-dependent receptor [Acidobacteria bacterium]|nr:TonB-dependent receptor [Acidobacteriota bacterium]
MIRWMARLTLSLAFVAAGASLATAQQGTAEVRGQVVDPQGGVLPGVTVSVRNQGTGFVRDTVTSAEGVYFASGLVPGVYEIAAELQGFKRFSRRDITLEIGKTATVDVRLDVGSLAQTITVTGESPLVDVTSKEVGGNITARELVELPSINRNFIGFIGLLPGIVPNISTESFGSDAVSVNGGDPRNNNYLLDGANNNDDVIGQRAGTQARTPIEAIQEFQVLTSQFDAEFGRTTGAVINAVTKQGSNTLRGSVFGYFQDAALTERDFFARKNNLEKPDTAQQQFGGTIGGPIARDKAHFFFSLERVRIDEGVTINIPARPEFNTTTTEQTRVWNTIVRADHQLTPNNTYGVRWLREQSPQFNQVIGAVTLAAAREEQDLDQTIVGTLNSVLGNTRVNTLRVAWTQEDVLFGNPCFNQGTQAACPSTLNYLTFTDQQNSTAQSRINNAYQIEDTFSWFLPGRRGDHDIRLGAQYQYSDQQFSNQGNLNGTFTFSSNRSFNAADPGTYPERFSVRVPGASEFKQHSQIISAFAQDKWKLNQRLTLSLGARYDVSISPVSTPDPLASALFSRTGVAMATDYPVDANDVAPRLGFAYDVSGNGRSVIRGGYGVFYETTRIGTISGFITGGVFSDSFTVNFPTSAADPGPSRGQLPTEPFLANGPTIDAALLAQRFPAGSRVKNTGTVSIDNADRHTPYTHESSIGYERQLSNYLSVNADYVHVSGRDILLTRNLNPGMRVNTTRTGTVVRLSSDFATSVNTLVNAGSTEYDALQLMLEKRFSSNWSARVSYTLADGRGDISGDGTDGSPFQLLDDLRLDANQAPTDFTRRHNFVLSGTLLVPRTGGLNVSVVARALSGLPFSITDSSTDPDQNGILFDPLQAGSYAGSGEESITVENEGGRNGARGPDFFQLDLRAGYKVRILGQRTIEGFVDIFNATDRANFANPSGDRRSTDFLRLTNLRDGGVPRTLQFGVRFAF